MLAWACTVHKVQGKQFKEVVISFNLNRQRSFNYGQMYVALSRVTSLNGLHLIGDYKSSAIRSDPRATAEYELLRKDYPIEPIEDCNVISPNSLTISLLNTRSLRKHAIDIACDSVLLESDLICLTETQIEVDSDISEISNILNEFTIIHNENTDKYCSLASCYKNTIQVVHNGLPSATLLTISTDTFLPYPVNALLLYRKHSAPVQNFTYLITHFLSRLDDNIHIILGDFNINAFLPNAQLDNVLSGYNLIVDEPTHLSGSPLDHVYIKKDLMSKMNVKCIVKNIFFSDHDAVKFQSTEKHIKNFKQI